MHAGLQRIEIEATGRGENDFSVDHAVDGQRAFERLNQLGEVAFERFAFSAAQVNGVGAAENEGSKAVPLGFVAPARTGRNFVSGFCEHGFNWAVQQKSHADTVFNMSALDSYLKELLEEASARLPLVTQKRMFGSNGFFANGKVFALTWDGRVVLKVKHDAVHAQLLAMAGAKPWSPMPSRESAMKHWVLVSEDLHEHADDLSVFVKQAHADAIEASKVEPNVKPVRRAGSRLTAAGMTGAKSGSRLTAAGMTGAKSGSRLTAAKPKVGAKKRSTR